LILDIAVFVQPPTERRRQFRESVRRSAIEKADHRHRRVLRVRRKRPRRSRTAEQRDELASP
jgi:hypothetical protein